VSVSGAPDYVEPVVGWRVWYVVEAGGKTRLSSVFHQMVWPTREPLAAVCLRSRFPRRRPRGDHAAPAASCGCGIYAASLQRGGEYLTGPRTSRRAMCAVIGRVALWGTVVECAQGWRASLAYPAQLYVPLLPRGRQTALARQFALDLTEYGVPVELLEVSTPNELIATLASLATAA
jgi:hypothetical protein